MHSVSGIMASSSDKVPPEIQEALDRLLDTGHTWVGTIEGTEGSVKASITDAQDTVATVTFPPPRGGRPPGHLYQRPRCVDELLGQAPG